LNTGYFRILLPRRNIFLIKQVKALEYFLIFVLIKMHYFKYWSNYFHNFCNGYD